MTVRRFTVSPDLPEELKPLARISKNLWFSWNPDVNRVFQALDPELWEEVNHNPVLLLAGLSKERKAEIVSDVSMMDRVRDAEAAFEDYIAAPDVYCFNLERPIDYRIAYFSMEFGLSESLPIYSGGLGLLAGDHLKSASNLGMPLVAVGLLYQKGYFTQYLNIDGWQQEFYQDNDFYNLPVTQALDGSGKQATVFVDIGGENVEIRIWKAQVGRIPLYLLDTNSQVNSEAARRITAELYGGDLEMRMKQELVLGIGGARALHEMGIWPFVFHLNEGHAAFAALERIRQTMTTYKAPFEVALESVSASTVFTTHTPVPAGIDLFPPYLVEKYFRNYVQSLGLSTGDLLALGRERPDDESAPLSMAVLAMRLSRGVNAVSELHSRVAKKMWRNLWPSIDEADIPIGFVTNGVHIPSYLSKEMADLLSRYLGRGWIQDPDNTRVWPRVYNIPNDELWRVHETRRDRLVAFCRRRLRAQMKSQTIVDVRRTQEVLSSDALTIGFARRFAPYKRAGLLFSDPDRLLRLVSDKRRPVQFIFAGKAHPKDQPGKELIKKVVHQSRLDGFQRKIVFLENYDINMAKYLVQGVDVWLNNPRRPNEACGTSGMKAAANGALNLSVLDGWWPEAYDGTNGWAIGQGEEYPDMAYQDRLDAERLFELLETEVVPTFFDRGPDGLPRRWIQLMKNSMAKICGRFNSHRMIEQYMDDYYVQAALAHQILGENRLARARSLSEWKKRVRGCWSDVKVVTVSESRGDRIFLGETLNVSADVRLGSLEEHEVIVDLCHGPADPLSDRIGRRSVNPMTAKEKIGEGVWRFEGAIRCDETGVYGYSIRVLPFHPYLFNPLSMNLVAVD
jgi:starch phosphorylase